MSYIDEKPYEVDNNDIYSKSVFLISSTYKSTLMENKLLALALSRIEKAYEDKEGSLIVEMNAKFIKDKLKIKGGSIYKNLVKAAYKLGGRQIGFIDPEREIFMFVPLITLAYYEKGILTLRFPPEMKKYLKGLTGNFTKLSLQMMLSFKSVYSFRLYELLKSKAYCKKGDKKEDYKGFKILMSLSELKLETGVVNSELKRVQNVLNDSRNAVPDFDKAVKVADEKMYARFDRFRDSCLDPAIKEINEKSDMKVSYEPVRIGHGGKITAINFYVEYGITEEQDEIVESYDKPFSEDDFIDGMFCVISEKIKISEARTIAQHADYRMDIITKADEYVKSKKVQNYVGYMIETIDKKYYEKYYIVNGNSNNTHKHKSFDEIKEQLVGEVQEPA